MYMKLMSTDGLGYDLGYGALQSSPGKEQRRKVCWFLCYCKESDACIDLQVYLIYVHVPFFDTLCVWHVRVHVISYVPLSITCEL